VITFFVYPQILPMDSESHPEGYYIFSLLLLINKNNKLLNNRRPQNQDLTPDFAGLSYLKLPSNHE